MKFKNHVKSLSFDDILLVPQYSEITSRNDVDLSSYIGQYKFNCPIISSPMDTVTEDVMAYTMNNYFGGLGIIHRYMDIEKQSEMIKKVLDYYWSEHQLYTGIIIGFAVGITGDYLERVSECWNSGGRIVCVDVAHGHHILMKQALKEIKSKFPDLVIIAGNVATGEGYYDLTQWGADAVRCGIGSGSICSTRIETGHGVPVLQTIMDCYDEKLKHGLTSKIIVDGGVRTSGDIVKSLAAGADFCMLGSLLAGTTESPGDVIEDNGHKWKSYRGMASKEAQVDWKMSYSSNEGISTRIRYKGDLKPHLTDILFNVKSGFSYSGVNTIQELRERSIYTNQTIAGQIESSTHILKT